MGVAPLSRPLNLGLLVGRVKYLSVLVDDILAYSRAGTRKEAIQTVRFGEFVRSAAEYLSTGKQIDITVIGEAEEIHVDATQLGQVFSNLIGNAIKYNDKPGAKITIACRQLRDRYEFSVADNGPGIASQYHEKIFELFETLGQSSSKESTGVGLAIVKKIVDAQGCTIRVESELGKGSNFIFTWPKGENISTAPRDNATPDCSSECQEEK